MTSQSRSRSAVDARLLPFLTGDDPRGRLLAAMAVAVSRDGYGNTTVGDVVRIAGTSRRTFYEHFADRQSCFLALGDAISDYLLDLVEAAGARTADLSWREGLARELDVYFEAMTINPGLTRAFLLELFGMGREGLAHRRAVVARTARVMQSLAAAARERHPELNEISFETATAVVGGLWELALVAAEEGHDEAMPVLQAAAVGLISDVLTA